MQNVDSDCSLLVLASNHAAWQHLQMNRMVLIGLITHGNFHVPARNGS